METSPGKTLPVWPTPPGHRRSAWESTSLASTLCGSRRSASLKSDLARPHASDETAAKARSTYTSTALGEVCRSRDAERSARSYRSAATSSLICSIALFPNSAAASIASARTVLGCAPVASRAAPDAASHSPLSKSTSARRK